MDFPVEKYGQFLGWIPETDIDGVDARKSYLANVKNIDFENNFLQNANNFSTRTHPAEIQALITAGYTLKSTVRFYHSERLNCFFYVLWKAGTPNDLKLFVEELENETVTELNIDPQNSDVTFTEEPEKINYSLVDNQLKINLNCLATYNALSKDVILNLTLIYLKSSHPTYWQDYVPEDTTPGTERLNGWYCFPRWLGWSFGDDSNIVVEGGATSFFEDFEDASYITGFSIGSSFVRTTGETGNKAAHEGSYSALYNGGVGADTTIFMSIADVYALKKISFWCVAYLLGGQARYVVIKSGSPYSDGKVLGTAEIYSNSQVVINWRFVEVDIDYLAPGNVPETIYITFEVPADSENLSYINIDELTISGEGSGTVLLAKNTDGQRALLKDTIALPVFAESTLSVPIKEIDWRVVEYELYSRRDSLFYKIAGLIIETDWTLDTDVVKKAIEYPAEDIEAENEAGINTTLNFNYGLGSTVRVDNQRKIYSEAFYKARTYFVKSDNYVYQSHISGTGRAQPDSFPFDEALEFGFFEPSKSQICIAIGISNLDELVILTDNKNQIYYVEGGGGIVRRTLKAINGAGDILHSKALLRDLDGTPTAEVMAWFNNEHIYIYTGGRNAPKSITEETHKNYWRTKAGKDEAVIFYNKLKNEIWIAFANKEVIIYSLSFGGFRRYELSFVIKEFIGRYNNAIYVLTDDNKIKYLNYAGSRLSAEIETHYNAGQTEQDTKILQEIYVAAKDLANSYLDFYIIFDNAEYLPIRMTLNKFIDLVLAPPSIRYGKIKFRLVIPPTAGTIREIGYSYSPDGYAQGDAGLELEGLGLNIGLKRGVQ